MDGEPIFFENQNHFRDWLREHHQTETELWVGFYKKATGLPSLTWSESVDQALCYGWIYGLRRSINDKSYKIRFTPRKPTSNWSAVNIKKIAKLKRKGLIRKAGLDAFEKREKSKSRVYTYEKAAVDFADAYESEFKNNKKAWNYFEKSTPGYRKQVIGWVMSAKKEETQNRRLQILIKHCDAGEKIPQYDWKKKS